MNYETERNINYANEMKRLLFVYHDEAPESLEGAIEALQATQEEASAIDLSDPDTVAIDVLTGLRHYARLHQEPSSHFCWHAPHVDLVATPEVNRLLEHLREYCLAHDVDWGASFKMSKHHFLTEVEEEVEFPTT